MRGRRVGALLCLVGAYLSFALPGTARKPKPLFQRLLGPLAELASDVQWIRFQRARIRGENERALFFAEGALSLDPESTAGWELLARHLALYLSSPEREADPQRRRAWFRAGLEVTRRGKQKAAEPARLDLLRGLLFLTKAQLDPGPFSEGERELLEEARRAFAAARLAGIFGAEDLESYVAEELSR